MKVLAVLLLCAFVAVQGRSSAVGKSTEAALGDNPWLVHLRLAISTSGYLRTGAGVLVSDRWVLSSALATADARFIWIRYGVVTVINPSLVTEASIVSNSDDVQFTLININRSIKSTDYISPVSLSAAVAVPETGTIAVFGEDDNGVPNEILKSLAVSLVSQDDGSIVASSEEGTTYESDLGAPLVSDGVLVAVLIEKGSDNAGTFLPVVGYLDWIKNQTEVELSSRSAQLDDSLRVQFAN